MNELRVEGALAPSFLSSALKGLLRGSILVIFLFGASVNALDNTGNAISLGYIKEGSTEVGALSWRPDFRAGPWALGININLPMGENRPTKYESIVFRYAEYDDSEKGLRYGIINNVTFGQGLLMKNYTTKVVGSIDPGNDQNGIKGFINAERAGIDFMATWSHVYALRVTERVKPWLILGQTYVTDADGIRIKEPDGTQKLFNPVSGIAIDASVPLPLSFVGYTEAAKLFYYGKGFTYGLKWGYDSQPFFFGFDAGYRFLENNFVPGYFNAEYESNPVNLVSYEATGQSKDGYAVEFIGKIANLLSINSLYESYRGSNTSINAAAATDLGPITLAAYMTQPNFVDFRSLTLEEGAIVGGTLGYKVNPFTLIMVHYKKAYDPVAGEVVESQYYEARVSL